MVDSFLARGSSSDQVESWQIANFPIFDVKVILNEKKTSQATIGAPSMDYNQEIVHEHSGMYKSSTQKLKLCKM